MRIGVTYENGKIFQHFGHTEQFKRRRLLIRMVGDMELYLHF